MRFALILLTCSLAACQPQAELAPEPASDPPAPDRAEILDTVDAFFLALGSADADALEQLYAPHTMVVIVTPEAEVERRVRSRAPAQTLERMRSGDYPLIRERYWDPTVLQRGPFAVVWTPYSIDVDGERSHCGIDVFNLSKPDDRWIIDTILFTVEPEACDELKPSEGDVVRPDFSRLDGGGE